MGRPAVGSIFSGVGGFDLGFEAAGFRVAWQIEVDRDCISVLERHWPDVPRYGDVRAVDPAALAPIDVVIGGFPCQDLSVAGKRAGLIGERSGLFWEAVRIVREMREATNGRYPAVVVLENVPGLLSSGVTPANPGGDFAVVLQGLSELGAAVAWRILDARFFGVPQRRRRVFIVADFAELDLGERRAAQILSLFQGGDGHPAARSEAGQGAPGDAADGAGVAGCFAENYSAIRGTDTAPTVSAEHGLDPRQNAGGLPVVGTLAPGAHPGRWDGHSAYNGHLLPVAAFGGNPESGPIDVATGCNTTQRNDFGTETFIVAAPLTAVAFDWQAGGGGTDDSFRGKSRQYITRAGDYAGALSTTRHDAVAISENQRAEVLETPYAHQLSAAGGKPGQGYQAVRSGMAVRRLTPMECERLMGWPDGHTERRADGSEIPDGPRYRMIGNGVVAPVAAWIAGRIAKAL